MRHSAILTAGLAVAPYARIALAVLIVFAAAPLAAWGDDPVDATTRTLGADDAATGVPSGLDVLSIGVFGLVLVVVFVVIVKRVRTHIAEQREREEQATQQFEQTVMRGVGGAGATPAPADAAPGKAFPALQIPPAAQAAPAPSAPPAAPAAPAGQGGDVEAALQRLDAASLIKEKGEVVALDPNLPPARRVVLRDGKSALVFPSGTPMALVLPHAKAYDWLLLAQNDGSVLVSCSLSDFIANALFDA